MNTLGYLNSIGIGRGASTGVGGISENDSFERNRAMNSLDSNGNSSADDYGNTESGDDEMEDFFDSPKDTVSIPTSGNKNHYSLHQQQVVPLPTSSQNEFQEINNGAMYSQTNQPQHISRLQFPGNDHNTGLTRPLQSSMHLERHNNDPFGGHRSMSPMEQDHSIDMLLAKELNQLSFQERNEINEEIHGVSSLYSVDETPQLISRSIEELQFEINHNVPLHRKVAYEKSQQIYKRNLQIQEQQGQPCSVPSSSLTNGRSSNNEGYVNDPDFLLLFLRREHFVVRKAALRLVNFMELVYELWGEDALTVKTWESQSYLSKFELEVFRTGTMQCLQGRDRAGRRILGNFAIDNADISVQNRIRMSLFVTMAALEDVETQKKGAVGITMWHNVSIDDLHKRGQCHNRISDAFPIRFSAIHFCLPHENSSSIDSKIRRTSNPQLLRLIKAMFVMSIGAELRPHLRVHIGSTVECIYALQSFGILAEQIPINTTTGKVKTKQHLKWLDLKLQKENALKENKNFNKIECPMIKDVLFGRGWPIMKHPGNVMLRNIIDSKLEEYQNEKTKRGKTLIAYSVVCIIKQKGDGGRFLKEDSGWWVEVSNDMARQKVSIAFRDARKLKSNHTRGSHVKKGSEVMQEKLMNTDATCHPSASKRKEGDMVSEGHYIQHTNDSSTSAFLGMDGITGIKRQRCFGNKVPQKQ